MSEFLATIPLGSVSVFESAPKLVSSPCNCTVGEAFAAISANNIYSVPLLDPNRKGLAYIDLQDIVRGIVEAIGPVDPINAREKGTKSILTGKKFLSKPVQPLVDLKSDPYATLSLESSLFDAIKALAEGNARRVALTDVNGEVVTVVSPSRVTKAISYFVNHQDVSKVLETKVSALAQSSVVCVDENDLVIDAARKMVESGKSSAAITSGRTNNLISVISIKDFTSFSNPDNWVKLFTPVGTFISDIRRKTPNAIFPAISARESDSLDRVLLRFVATNVHRLFVTDNNHHVLGVISQRDLLRAFIESKAS